MNEENKKVHAAKVLETVCSALTRKELTFQRTEDGEGVHFGIEGKDLQIIILFKVNADGQTLKLYSPLPFEFGEDKRLEGAIAVCAASFGMPFGNFDFIIGTGDIVYRDTLCFEESEITEERIIAMLDYAVFAVEKYNDKFLALSKGIIEVTDFLEE